MSVASLFTWWFEFRSFRRPGLRRCLISALIAGASLASSPADAQELVQQTQLRFGATVEKKVIKKVRVYGNPEMRTDGLNPERYLLEVGGRYKPIDYFAAKAGFRGDVEETRDGLEHGFRPKLDLVTMLPLGDFEAHARWRYTYSFGPDRNRHHRFRYRVGLEYDIPKSKLDLDASAEPFHQLNGPAAGVIYKMRYRAGVRWKFYGSKKHDHWLSLGYMLDYFLKVRLNRHIPMLNYKVRFD